MWRYCLFYCTCRLVFPLMCSSWYTINLRIFSCLGSNMTLIYQYQLLQCTCAYTALGYIPDEALSNIQMNTNGIDCNMWHHRWDCKAGQSHSLLCVLRHGSFYNTYRRTTQYRRTIQLLSLTRVSAGVRTHTHARTYVYTHITTADTVLSTGPSAVLQEEWVGTHKPYQCLWR